MKNRQWVVSLAPYPVPDLPPVLPDRAKAMLDVWEKYVAPVVSASGDFEDFFEQAARLEAAVTAFGAENIWLTKSEEAHPCNLVTGEVRDRKTLVSEGAGEYGIVYRFANYKAFMPQQQALADGYQRSGTFAQFAGRTVTIAGHNPDRGGKDLFAELKRLGDEGVSEVIVKSGQAKYVFERLALRPGLSEDDIYELFDENVGWALVHLEGLSDAFLIQSVIPMSYEYRFFVVNQELVTGAGCVEEFTPLNNQGQFDVVMRENRQAFSPVESKPELLDAYKEFAQQVIAGYRVEFPEMKHYGLDVAMSTDGPVMIELNGLYNSGLYASDPRFVTQALSQ